MVNATKVECGDNELCKKERGTSLTNTQHLGSSRQPHPCSACSQTPGKEALLPTLPCFSCAFLPRHPKLRGITLYINPQVHQLTKRYLSATPPPSALREHPALTHTQLTQDCGVLIKELQLSSTW